MGKQLQKNPPKLAGEKLQSLVTVASLIQAGL